MGGGRRGGGGGGVKRTPLEKTALKKPSLIIRVNKTISSHHVEEIFAAHISLTFCFKIQTFQNLKATYWEKSWLKHLIIFEEMKLMPVVMKNCY